jgi:phosphohistidine swiveling domain-containing protein
MANAGFFETYYDISHYHSLIPGKEEARERLAALIKNRSDHRAAFGSLLERIGEDSYTAALFKTANEATYFRSRRTEMLYSSSAFNQKLFEELAKRLTLSATRDLVWFYAEEITKALGGEPPDTASFEMRKSAYALLSDYDGKYWHWEGKDAEKIYNSYSTHSSIRKPMGNELRGRGAFPGIVTGPARLIVGLNDMFAVKEGDILVTHATNVNFMPILRKVAGIVTEEGGILSHASIISRELKIPCIIGTRIATKVFKDGDIVEVDADRGIARILTDNNKVLK